LQYERAIVGAYVFGQDLRARTEDASEGEDLYLSSHSHFAGQH